MLTQKENTRRKKGNFHCCPHCDKILSNLRNEISFPAKLSILNAKSHHAKYNKFIHLHKHKFNLHSNMKNSVISAAQNENPSKEYNLSFLSTNVHYDSIDLYGFSLFSSYINHNKFSFEAQLKNKMHNNWESFTGSLSKNIGILETSTNLRMEDYKKTLIEYSHGRYMLCYAKIYLQNLPFMGQLQKSIKHRYNKGGKQGKRHEMQKEIIDEFNKYYRFNYL